MNPNYRNDNFDDIYFACTNFFSRKWQLSILLLLIEGPKYFGEILHFHENLSKKYLSLNLKKLEEKGVIKREIIQEGKVIKVLYSLTSQGQELKPILDELAKYGSKYRQR